MDGEKNDRRVNEMEMTLPHLPVCPSCKENPRLVIDDLGRGNGRGYPGEFNIYIGCRNERCHMSIQTEELNTIGGSGKDELIEECENIWMKAFG